MNNTTTFTVENHLLWFLLLCAVIIFSAYRTHKNQTVNRYFGTGGVMDLSGIGMILHGIVLAAAILIYGSAYWW